ncbi:MAG: DUF1643 domain-containing protein [Pyrinomonadaceae bacterium]
MSAIQTLDLTAPAGAIISPCLDYRYALWRIWDRTRPLALYLGLNPSTATANVVDATLRQCMMFSAAFGFGGTLMGNLFGYRTKHPRLMRRASDPVGPDNDEWLLRLGLEAKMVIAAWGANGGFMGRDRIVLEMFPEVYCLKVTGSGHPHHPLYLKKETRPIPYYSSLSLRELRPAA